MSGSVREKSGIMEFQTGRQNVFVRLMYTLLIMDFMEFQLLRSSMDLESVRQIPVYAYSAQAEGYFPIYLKGGSEALSDSTRQKYDTNTNRERAEKLRQLCEIKDISLSWLMAEYVLRSPFPAVFILGGSNEKRLREIMEYESNHVSQLTDEEWDYLMRNNEKQ